MAYTDALDRSVFIWGTAEEVDFSDVLKIWMCEEWKAIVGRGVVIMVAAGLVGLMWLLNGGKGGSAKKAGAQKSVGPNGVADDSTLTSIKSPRYNTSRRCRPNDSRVGGRGVPLMVFTDLNVFSNEPSCSEDEDGYESVPNALDTNTESVSTANSTLDSSSGNTSSNSSNSTSNSANASPTHSLKRARSSDSNTSDATTSSKRHHSAASAEEQSLDATAGALDERAWIAEHYAGAGSELYLGSDDDDSGDDGDDEEDVEDDIEEDAGDDIEDDVANDVEEYVEDDAEENDSEYDAEDDGDDWSEEGSECDSPGGWAKDYAGDVIMFDVDSGLWLEY